MTWENDDVAGPPKKESFLLFLGGGGEDPLVGRGHKDTPADKNG